MEGAATPDFLWVVLMQGHQRKAVMDTYSAIRTPAQLGEQMRSVFIFIFFPHPIIFELLKGPIESIHAVLFLRPEYTAWDVHRGLGLLFQFLGKMDYFLHLLLL